jgi:hypothetical protein
MIEFKKALHNIRQVEIVEVWLDGKLKAAIYPTDAGNGIRVISAWVKGEPQLTLTDVTNLRGWNFNFEE